MLLIAEGRVTAQPDKLNSALDFLTKGQLDSAKILIDQAANDTAYTSNPFTWQVKGFIYKELYKSKEIADKKSPFRIEAIASLEKSLLLDKSGEYEKDNRQGIRFLASKFKNDAAESMDTIDYKLAIENYQIFKRAKKVADPDWNVADSDIEFNKAIGGVYTQLSEKRSGKEKEHYFNLAKESFETVLTLDSSDISANYNLGRLYYNHAAQISFDMPYVDLEEIDSFQTQILDYAKQSLPFMERAYRLIRKKGDEYYKDARINDVLMALSSINVAIHEDKRAQEYKDEQKKVEEKK